MADNLPLLVFPKVNKTEAPKRPGFPGKKLHFPSHEQQIQHEVLEQNTPTTHSYPENTEITLQVICKPEATDKLDETIFYGLAVTLEVEENINIYQEIQSKIKAKQPVPIPT